MYVYIWQSVYSEMSYLEKYAYLVLLSSLMSGLE